MESYRRANLGDWEGARAVIKDLRSVAEITMHGPWRDELIGGEKEAFMMMEELPFILDRFAEEIYEHRTK